MHEAEDNPLENFVFFLYDNLLVDYFWQIILQVFGNFLLIILGWA